MLLVVVSCHWANAQQIPTFTKITQGALVTDHLESRFGVWGDYDNDGRLDVLVTAPANQWRLYHNDGNALFSAVTTGPMSQRSQGMWGAWGDPDNDGDLDFFAGRTWSGSESPAMYWNDGQGNFVRQPVGASWTSNHIPLQGVVGAWGDFDRDGFPDALLGAGFSFLTGTITNQLLHNNGDGTFAIVTNSALNIENDQIQYVCTVDYDRDGDLDLVPVRVDQPLPTQFYHNDGHGVFTEATPEPILSEVGYRLTAAWADFDNDGDLDVIFAGYQTERERFYVNNGNGTFTPWSGQPDRFESDASYGSFAGGIVAWGDFDNDGYLDLWVMDAVRKWLWRNLGNGTFDEIDCGSPLTDPGDQSACWVDFNNDGYLDLFVANRGATNGLYFNNGNTNHWLEVKLCGMVSDRLAVGARIFATATIRGQVTRQMRVITASDADQTLVAHFGLSDATNVDLLRIEWPIGVVQELTNVVANQILTVTEHQAAATTAPNLTVSKPAAGPLKLTATGQTNLRYAFEASTNLVQWTKIAVRTNLTGTVDYTPPTSSSPQRFYRVQVP
jgi:hypothetical protein